MLVELLIVVVVLGLVLYLFNTVIPVPGWVKTVINVIVCLFVMVWLLELAGFSGPHLFRHLR